MQLGERVRSTRQERHLTVAALAEASNLTKGFISQVEAGKSLLISYYVATTPMVVIPMTYLVIAILTIPNR